MSMYEKDSRGEFRVEAEWLDTWGGEHGHPGFCRCELRQYADGSAHVMRGEPVYTNDCAAEVGALLSIHASASRALKNKAGRATK